EIVPGARLFSKLDFEAFASEGENYLRRVFEPRWFEHQRRRSSPEFIRERMAAAQLVHCGKWTPYDLGPDDYLPKVELLESVLERKSMLIASVNVRVLYSEPDDSAHAVLIYKPQYGSARMSDRVYLHDPAKREGAGLLVQKH